jgi:hypothetical protein
MQIRERLAATLTVPVFGLGVRAGAAPEDPEPIRLLYRAAVGCPSEAEFIARVRARTQRAQFVAQGASVRTFSVEIALGTLPTGSVTIVDGDREPLRRTIHAATCAEVADALGLMVALAVDPSQAMFFSSPSGSVPAGSAPTPSSAPAAAAPSAATPSASATSADSVTAAAPRIATSASSVPITPDPIPQPQPPPADSESRSPAPVPAHDSPVVHGPLPATPPAHTQWPSRMFAGAQLAAATGVAPETILAGAFVLGWQPGSVLGIPGIRVRAAFARAQTAKLDVPGGGATFTWTVARAEACVLLSPANPVRLGPCLRTEGGVLDVTGSDIAFARTQHSPWAAVGPVANAEWSLLGALFLDLEVGPTLRAVTNRFFFLPDTTAYTVPVVGFDAEAGLAAYFL